jgi:hypothetical protein
MFHNFKDRKCTTKFENSNKVSTNKFLESVGKVPTVNTIALRKGTENNNVLRNFRIKKELKDFTHLSTQGPYQTDIGYYSNDIHVN